MKSLDIYEVLVKEHEKMLQAYCLGIVGDPQLAEDISQEAFIQAYRRLSALRNKKAFASWLRAIARNIALSELKRRGREIPTAPEVMSGMEDVFSALDSDRLGDGWGERAALLERCFTALPQKLQDVCRLHYLPEPRHGTCA